MPLLSSRVFLTVSHSDGPCRIYTRTHLAHASRDVCDPGGDMHPLPRAARQAAAVVPRHPRVHPRDVLRVDDILRLRVQVERDRVRGEHGQHWRVRVPAKLASGDLEGHGVHGEHLARR